MSQHSSAGSFHNQDKGLVSAESDPVGKVYVIEESVGRACCLRLDYTIEEKYEMVGGDTINNTV